MQSGKPTIQELAWEAARELLDANNFVTLEDTEEIYRYEDGVYRKNGEAYIKRKIQENAKEGAKSEITTHLVKEATAHVRRETLRPRRIFEESNPHLVLSNCLLDLETLKLESLSPDYYALNKMPVQYDATADYHHSLFWTFINEILSPEDVRGVQEELGAILRKKYLTKKLSIWHGDTDTGKTTLAAVFLTFLGPENVSSVGIQQLSARDRFSTAQVYGKMANIRDDLSKDVVYSVGKLKELTGGFQVQGENKFEDPFDFVNYAYMIFTCNILPLVEEDDSAFYNRVMLRKFRKKFGGKDAPDRELLDKLTTPQALSAILNWGLEGLKRLKANGWNFSNTKSTDATREEYKRKSDPVWAYATDRLSEESDGVAFKEALFNDFKAYCAEANIPLIGRDEFFKKLPEKVTVVSGQRANPDSGGAKKHCFLGIAIKPTSALNGRRGVPSVPGVLEQEEQAEQGSANLRLDHICEYCGAVSPLTKTDEGHSVCAKCSKEAGP